MLGSQGCASSMIAVGPLSSCCSHLLNTSFVTQGFGTWDWDGSGHKWNRLRHNVVRSLWSVSYLEVGVWEILHGQLGNSDEGKTESPVVDIDIIFCPRFQIDTEGDKVIYNFADGHLGWLKQRCCGGVQPSAAWIKLDLLRHLFNSTNWMTAFSRRGHQDIIDSCDRTCNSELRWNLGWGLGLVRLCS